MLSKIDKKRLVDAGMATLIAGLQGAKAVLDTTSIPGASAVFSIILTCIDEAQVSYGLKSRPYVSNPPCPVRKRLGTQIS